MPKVTAEYRAQRREHVLAAARRCFVRNGFHAASMQDLVAEAGMSSGAVYRYFPSKDAMIEAIAAENLDQVVAVLEQAIDGGASPPAAIAAVLEFVTKRHAQDGFAAIALLVWSEALRNAALAVNLRDATASAVAALSKSAQPPSGANKSLDPTTVAELLVCVLPGYLMRLALGGPEAIQNVPTAVQKVFSASRPSRSSKPARK